MQLDPHPSLADHMAALERRSARAAFLARVAEIGDVALGRALLATADEDRRDREVVERYLASRRERRAQA